MTSESISMLRMTLVGDRSDDSSGVTVTLPTLRSSVLPTVIPSITTCGTGSADTRILPIFTGSFSLAEASFSIRGM